MNLAEFEKLQLPEGTNLVSFGVAFNWLEVLFLCVVVLKSSVRFVGYKIDFNIFRSSHRSDSYHNKSDRKTTAQAGPSG